MEHRISGKRVGVAPMGSTGCTGTHMCEDLLCQPTPLRLVEGLVEAQQPSASLQTVAGHLQLVHCVDVLYVHLDAWAIWCLRSPHVEVLMSPRLKVYRVVAVV